jgi:hypothetical protein
MDGNRLVNHEGMIEGEGKAIERRERGTQYLHRAYRIAGNSIRCNGLLLGRGAID